MLKVRQDRVTIWRGRPMIELHKLDTAKGASNLTLPKTRDILSTQNHQKFKFFDKCFRKWLSTRSWRTPMINTLRN